VIRATRPPRIFVHDLLPDHLEEVEFLLSQLQAAQRSPRHWDDDVQWLKGRITAHLDGLRVWPEKTIAVVQPGLSGEADVAFTAAYVLLSLDHDQAANVAVEALLKAEGEAIEGLRLAFCNAPMERVERRLQEVVAAAPAAVASVAAEALAVHGKLDVKHPRFAEFFRDESPLVRRAAWRAVAAADTSNKKR
jgi:hypothetical protein